MKPPNPRPSHPPGLSPAALAAREKRRVARSKREAPADYAARILRELEALEELSEPLTN